MTKRYPPVQVAFGARVKQLRESLGLTQEQLGEAAELSPQNVAKIEAGDRFVTADSLARLAAALKARVPDLFVAEAEDKKKPLSRRRLESLLQLIHNQPDSKLDLIHDVAARILRG